MGGNKGLAPEEDLELANAACVRRPGRDEEEEEEGALGCTETRKEEERC